MIYDLPYLDEIVERLRAELPASRLYHSVQHTLDEVLPATWRLADILEISPNQKQLLLAAAALHDTGYINGPDEGHEERSIKIAHETLGSYGYTSEQLETISDIIRATKWPQDPHNLVEQILADADLSTLGYPWERFLRRSGQLRAEMEAIRGKSIPEDEWYRGQIAFLSAHSYFTDAAHSLYDEQKAKNIAKMRDHLEGHQAQEAGNRQVKVD